METETSSPTPQTVFVVGRFPPPLDGQAIATRRLAQLLEPHCDLRRIDLSTGSAAKAQSEVRFRAGHIAHYASARGQIRSALRAAPNATILWTGVSGSTLGHYRDILVSLPAFRRCHRVHAVVHWGNFDELFRSPKTRITARSMLDRLTSIVFLNQLLRDRCRDFVPDSKARIIPNTIDESIQLSSDEVETKQRVRKDRKVFRLLYLGSMTPSKGWKDAVFATEIMHKKGLSVELDLVGRWESDDDKASFTDHVVRGGLGSVVHHHGAVSDRTLLKEMYARSDAFLLPTYYPTEAQPLTIIEALNAGTPVISTSHAGIPEMIADGKEGFLVEKHRPDSIVEAVESLFPYEAWRQHSVAARKRFETTFHPDRIVEKWLELIKP